MLVDGRWLLHPWLVQQDLLFTTTDVSQLLGVSESTVRNWDRAGVLLSKRTRSGVRIFRREDVERLSRERDRLRASSGRSMTTPE